MEKGQDEQQRTFVFIRDGGHAWVSVPRQMVVDLGVKVSDCSYVRGDTMYLEEDCDAEAFHWCYYDRHHCEPQYETHFIIGECAVRRLPRYIGDFASHEACMAYQRYIYLAHKQLIDERVAAAERAWSKMVEDEKTRDAQGRGINTPLSAN